MWTGCRDDGWGYQGGINGMDTACDERSFHKSVQQVPWLDLCAAGVGETAKPKPAIERKG